MATKYTETFLALKYRVKDSNEEMVGGAMYIWRRAFQKNKKEDLITYQQDRLKVGSSIDEIHHYAKFIDSMEKTIADVQQKVVQARAKMNWHEQKLLEKKRKG